VLAHPENRLAVMMYSVHYLRHGWRNGIGAVPRRFRKSGGFVRGKCCNTAGCDLSAMDAAIAPVASRSVHGAVIVRTFAPPWPGEGRVSCMQRTPAYGRAGWSLAEQDCAA
jgi:hypothetical protein